MHRPSSASCFWMSHSVSYRLRPISLFICFHLERELPPPPATGCEPSCDHGRELIGQTAEEVRAPRAAV